MMQSRFKINFNLSSQPIERKNKNVSYNTYVSVPPVVKSVGPSSAPMSFMTSMINRVHTTKPGCSACGKKVM
jgi:hypothetical protein